MLSNLSVFQQYHSLSVSAVLNHLKHIVNREREREREKEREKEKKNKKGILFMSPLARRRVCWSWPTEQLTEAV